MSSRQKGWEGDTKMSYWDDFENNFKILGIYTKILILHYQEPVVGSVIQASGTVEFEDGL